MAVVLPTSSVITGCGIFGTPTSQRRIFEGNELYEQGPLDEAIDKYTEAIRIEPTWAEPWCKRGATYCELGQIDRGIEDLNEAIRLALSSNSNSRGCLTDKSSDKSGSFSEW